MLAEVDNTFQRHGIRLPKDWWEQCSYFVSLNRCSPSQGEMEAAPPIHSTNRHNHHSRPYDIPQTSIPGIEITIERRREASVHTVPSQYRFATQRTFRNYFILVICLFMFSLSPVTTSRSPFTRTFHPASESKPLS